MVIFPLKNVFFSIKNVCLYPPKAQKPTVCVFPTQLERSCGGSDQPDITGRSGTLDICHIGVDFGQLVDLKIEHR